MATVSIGGGQKFPDGTSVGVYPKSARVSGGAPSGSAITSATVTAGALTFTGLVLNTPYVAYAQVSGEHRYVEFNPAQSDIALKRLTQAGIVLVDVTIDLPSIAAGAAADVNVALPSGTCKAGDIAVAPLLPALNAGLHIQGVGVVANDQLRVRAQNTTAGALDAAAVVCTVAIIKAT